MTEEAQRSSTGIVDAWLGARFRVRRQGTLEATAHLMRSFGHEQWSAGTVSNFELGRRNVNATELSDLCTVYGVTLRDLFRKAPGEDHEPTGPVRDRAHCLLAIDADRSLVGGDPEDLARLRRERTEDRVMQRVFTKVFGHSPRPGTKDAMKFVLYVQKRYGRHLLEQRELLESQGMSAQWATRRMIEDLRSDAIDLDAINLEQLIQELFPEKGDMR